MFDGDAADVGLYVFCGEAPVARKVGALGAEILKFGPLGMGAFGIAFTVVIWGGGGALFCVGMGTALLRSSGGRLNTDW